MISLKITRYCFKHCFIEIMVKVGSDTHVSAIFKIYVRMFSVNDLSPLCILQTFQSGMTVEDVGRYATSVSPAHTVLYTMQKTYTF